MVDGGVNSIAAIQEYAVESHCNSKCQCNKPQKEGMEFKTLCM